MQWLKRMRKENAKGDKENAAAAGRENQLALRKSGNPDTKSSIKDKLQQFARGAAGPAQARAASPTLQKVR